MNEHHTVYMMECQAISLHYCGVVKHKRLHWVTLGALRKDQDIVRTPLTTALRPSVPMPVHEIGRAENLTRQPELLGVGKADEVGTDGLDDTTSFPQVEQRN